MQKFISKIVRHRTLEGYDWLILNFIWIMKANTAGDFGLRETIKSSQKAERATLLKRIVKTE